MVKKKKNQINWIEHKTLRRGAQHWDLFWAIDPLIEPVNKRGQRRRYGFDLAIELWLVAPWTLGYISCKHKLIARKSCSPDRLGIIQQFSFQIFIDSRLMLNMLRMPSFP